MKKLFLLLFIALLFSCENPTGLTESEIQIIEVTPEPEEEPETPPPENPEQKQIILALYDGSELKYYDGESFTTAIISENIIYAQNKTLSVDDILYRFDSYGVEIESFHLTGIPEYLLYVDNSVVAFYYSFKSAVQVPTGQVIVTENNNQLTNLTDSKVPFKVFPELFIYDLEGRTAHMNNIMMSFAENHFYTSRWQKCGDLFYSNYGMIFDNSEFTENATALQDFKSTTYPYAIASLPNAERPSLHPAGQNYEHSEYVAYFIESTSGHLIRYVPSIDQYQILPKIYQGPNVMSTGNTIAADFKPQWINGELYFHHEGSIKVYNPEIGSVDIFAVDQEVWKW
jgi:hypothetical protein